MSANANNNTRDTNGSYKFIRAVEEAFFLLDGDHNRSVNGDDFCAIAKSVGKEKRMFFFYSQKICIFFSID
jgi:hypothetical protein